MGLLDNQRIWMKPRSSEHWTIMLNQWSANPHLTYFYSVLLANRNFGPRTLICRVYTVKNWIWTTLDEMDQIRVPNFTPWLFTPKVKYTWRHLNLGPKIWYVRCKRTYWYVAQVILTLLNFFMGMKFFKASNKNLKGVMYIEKLIEFIVVCIFY